MPSPMSESTPAGHGLAAPLQDRDWSLSDGRSRQTRRLGLEGSCGIRQEPHAGCGAALAGGQCGGGGRRGLRPFCCGQRLSRPTPSAPRLPYRVGSTRPGLSGCCAQPNAGCEPVRLLGQHAPVGPCSSVSIQALALRPPRAAKCEPVKGGERERASVTKRQKEKECDKERERGIKRRTETGPTLERQRARARERERE